MMVFSKTRCVVAHLPDKENKMDKRFGYYIFGGLLIGVVFGSLWAANGNMLLGVSIGALVGTAIGWFAAAAVLEREKKEKGGK
jgi:uncharacterized membrane protein